MLFVSSGKQKLFITSGLVIFIIWLYLNSLHFFTGDLIADRNVIQDNSISTSCSRSSLIDFGTLKNLPTDHPLLLDYIRCHHIKPPSTLPYPSSILTGDDPSEFKSLISKLFRNKTGGFFIECGANDGHFRSNTWALERDKKWSGLLIEANPEMSEILVTRNRKAFFADVCLSPYNNVSEIEFLVSAKRNHQWEQGIGKIAMADDIVYEKLDKKRTKFKFQTYGVIPCFPLKSLMLAINVNHVDYFSLDVQGVEAKILKTLPFDDDLTIDYIQVEYELDPEGKDWIKSFMESKNYKVVYDGHVNFVFKRITG